MNKEEMDPKIDTVLSSYQKIILSDNVLPGGRLVFEIPSYALAETIEFAQQKGFEHELTREIGNELYMCVLRNVK